MTTLTDERRKEIKARWDATTPGEWVLGITIDNYGWPVMRLRDMETGDASEAGRNVKFIEEAHNHDIPDLLAALEAAEAERDALRAVVEQVYYYVPPLGNGVTDDTPAIRELLNKNGFVILDGGVYKIGETDETA